ILASFLFCSHPSLRFKTDSNPTRRTPSRPRVSASTFPVNFICGVQVMSETTISLGGTELISQSYTVGADTFVTGGTVGYDVNFTIDAQGTYANGLFAGPINEVYVEPGGILQQATMKGAVDIYNYGTASQPFIEEGVFIVESGGTATAAHITLGEEWVEAGGTDIGAIDAGSQAIYANGVADQTTITGSQIVYGIANGATIDSNGFQWNLSGTVNNDLINKGGLATIASGAVVDAPTINGGKLVLGAGSTLTNSATFTDGSAGTLDIEGTTGTFDISGFGAGDTISVPNISLASAAQETLGSNGELIVSGLSGAITLEFGAAMAGAILNETGGDTTITEVPCFVEGTHILAIRNNAEIEIPVEDLEIGDTVMTKIHGRQKIKWIGTHAYKEKFISGNHLMEPICFRANSIGGGIPKRDMWLSPGHALVFHTGRGTDDLVLIQARHLINGVSITQEPRDVRYFHVELPEHDILTTDGCQTESYLDNGNRKQFHNAMEFAALYPNQPGTLPQAMKYPLLDEGPLLQSIKDTMALRAGIIRPKEQFGECRGYVDNRTPNRIAGWVQNADQPNNPIELLIMAGGEIVGQTTANRDRADLRALKMGNGYHGFDVAIPQKFAQTALSVVRKLNGWELPYAIEASTACREHGIKMPAHPTDTTQRLKINGPREVIKMASYAA
ncbi:MAG: Hint domain-containing protein, partial [Alphaproteobacteria bacterium]|nr:Hint domain-containing protein [Alphaproteobacteria bacterium]